MGRLHWETLETIVLENAHSPRSLIRINRLRGLDGDPLGAGKDCAAELHRQDTGSAPSADNASLPRVRRLRVDSGPAASIALLATVPTGRV